MPTAQTACRGYLASTVWKAAGNEGNKILPRVPHEPHVPHVPQEPQEEAEEVEEVEEVEGDRRESFHQSGRRYEQYGDDSSDE